MNSTRDQLPPAQLWIGNPDLTRAHTKRFLQTLFSSCGACGVCTICIHIEREQHHAVTWLIPERQYTLESLQGIMRTLSFALDAGQHHVFVIQHADLLTPACSNSLLKSIEEPPTGYHFILLAERLDDMLPTVRSRCVVHTLQHAALSHGAHDMLFAFFVTADFASPAAFSQELEQSKITEHETLNLLDRLLAYWLDVAKKSLVEGDSKRKKQAQRVIAMLRAYLTTPLMPGSSKLLWRDFFLQLKLAKA